MSESIEYVEPYSVPRGERHEIVRELRESGPMKPWTLMGRVETPRKALKKLVLDCEIEVDASGDIRLPR